MKTEIMKPLIVCLLSIIVVILMVNVYTSDLEKAYKNGYKDANKQKAYTIYIGDNLFNVGYNVNKIDTISGNIVFIDKLGDKQIYNLKKVYKIEQHTKEVAP